jgi:predicted dehydrogenase
MSEPIKVTLQRAENVALSSRNSIRFFWVSGGLFSEMTIHQIDECCWLKDALPVAAHGVGGRAPNSSDCSQNFDVYAIEFTFADGAKANVVARYLPECHNEFATYAHGTRCAAQFSGNIHAPTVQIYNDNRIAGDNIAWRPEPENVNPWQAEWNVLLEAIRNDRPHNEAKRAALSNLAAIMGRAAVHSGKIITWDQAITSNFQFCPNIDTLTDNSPAPVQADAHGRYPVPVPGVWSEI